MNLKIIQKNFKNEILKNNKKFNNKALIQTKNNNQPNFHINKLKITSNYQ